jgi:hypothetical protein
MTKPNLPPPLASLIDHLAAFPNVVAITRRRAGRVKHEPPHAGWELGLYYQGEFDPESITELPGTERAPGDRGRMRNGAAALIIEGFAVNVRYRNIDDVNHWINEARAGRFEVDGAPGHLAGIPTYTLAAELALDEVVAGSLETAIDYPNRLASKGATRWRHHAKSSLDHANDRAAHGDLAGVMGHLARACVEVAHARLCEAREWTLNEKEILERAELAHMNQILTALNTDPVTLTQRVLQARTLLLD